MLSLNDLVDALLQPQQDAKLDSSTVVEILAKHGFYRFDDSRLVGLQAVDDSERS